MTTHREPKDEKGAALVEFAFVFPIFILILFGLISFGMILALKQSVTNASSEGARAAIGAAPIGAETLTDAQKRVAVERARGALGWIGTARLAATTFTPQVAPCASSTGQCITLTVKYPYAANKLVPLPAFGVDDLTSTATVQVGS